jgi:chromosome segregation ATPase
MSAEIARYNVLFEDIDRRVRVLSEAYAATNEQLTRMDTRLHDLEGRLDIVEMTGNVLGARLERLTPPTRRKKS